MVKKGETYKCSVCGNIIEVSYAGGGTLVCCGKPMILQKENMDDKASLEKHVPVIDGNIVKVGSVLHPMEEKHYIMWIEAETEDGEVERVFLEPGEEPIIEFDFDVKVARAYCNLHGLWRSK